jgi:hypothetical protein
MSERSKLSSYPFLRVYPPRRCISFSGQQPNEPWIAGLLEAVLDSKDLRNDVSVPTVAETITEIARTTAFRAWTSRRSRRCRQAVF